MVIAMHTKDGIFAETKKMWQIKRTDKFNGDE